MKKSYKKTCVLLGIITVIILSIGFKAYTDREFKIVKNLDIFYSLFKELNYWYVDETNPEKLIKTGIDEMLKSLDPYTTFIPESEMENFNFMTTGKYGGIGALIRKAGDYTIISEPYEGFPAQKAGLMAGDTIISIDDKSIKGLDLGKVSDRLRGKPGTKIKIKITRPGIDNYIIKKLIREQVTIDNVPYFGKLNKNTGYILLSNFTRGASGEVKDALQTLKEQGISSLVLDLRNNPGGLLQEAVNVSNLFVSKGQEIVSTKGKIKQWDKTYKTTSAPVDTLMHLTILVNRGSASASEIVAGSLQDLDRAVIMGQRTFGKGLVQTTRPLSYNSQLKVTTAKYYIPSGRCIQALDYSHRNEDGSVGYIPDSLISEFTTRNGRKVYDGGGITPDIKMTNEKINRITVNLYSQNILFDFATYYRIKHDSLLQPPGDFEITDQIYDQFIEFAQNQNFDYETASDIALKELIQTAKKEKYYALAENEFNLLQERLDHNLRDDLLLYQEEISNLLREEIVSRYYYQRGRVQSQLTDDDVVHKAIEILIHENKYNDILTGIYENEKIVLNTE